VPNVIGRQVFFFGTRTKTKSPCPTLRSNRDKSGAGSSPCSLSHADIWRSPFGGCRLPDAILHGKRSLRPRSRAVQRLTVAEFRVRLFSSLGLVVAPPAHEPGQDTFAISFPRLDHLAPGRPPLLTVRSPGATGLASSLSGCFFVHMSAVRFLHRRRFGRFSQVLPRPRVLPGSSAHFVRPFGVFLWADPAFMRDRQSRSSVLMHSSNRLPSG
jgi:hypothetical protein